MLLVISGEQMGDMSPSLMSGPFPAIARELYLLRSMHPVDFKRHFRNIFPAG